MHGGDSAYPPKPPLRIAMVSYYLPVSYRFRGVPQRRGRRHSLPEPKKERLERYVEDFS
jgi:hypothetical protein